MLNRSPILIVEDEPFIALELQALVEDAGGQVVGPVGSANAALTLLQTCVVGAAILDVQLSDRDVTPVAEALVALGVPMFFRAPSAFRRTFSSDTQCDRLPKAGFGRATA